MKNDSLSFFPLETNILAHHVSILFSFYDMDMNFLVIQYNRGEIFFL